MRGFYVLWAGQFASLFASRMTGFAIALWAWDLTQSATSLALVGVAAFAPQAILSPLAGALVDRWDRKLIMALSDAAAALSTAVLLVLFATDQIQVWHLYVAGAFSGAFGSFQFPAYSAVITTMVPKEMLSRANSLRSLVQSASGVGAPLLAGSLIALIRIDGIMMIDLASFGLALGSLLLVRIPKPEVSAAGVQGRGSLFEETIFGFRYILASRSLFAVMVLFTLSNVSTGFGYSMGNPMVLAKTGDNEAILGVVRAGSSLGFVAGGLLMSIWPGPKRKIFGVNISFILWGLLGASAFGAGWTLPVWLAGTFLMGMFNPIINSLYMAILQSKVAPDLQGRVFGVEFLVTTISFPLAQLVGGALSDNVFEPALQSGGRLADSLGRIIGTGDGAGIGLTILLGGIVSILVGVLGFVLPDVREIEKRMPDYDDAPGENGSLTETAEASVPGSAG